jgi:hypothetical protein
VKAMNRMNGGRRPARRGFGAVLGWAAMVLLAAATPIRLGAQQSGVVSSLNALGNPNAGFQLYNVQGFAGWESVLNPQGGFLPSNQGLGADEMLGGAASAGWSRHGQKTNLSITYTLSYDGYIHYSSLNALNHNLVINGSRRLSPKWTLGFSAAAAISTYDQMLFDPTVFSSVAAAPGTFDDLASAVLAGKYNNDQLASLLTGAPVLESPARTVFFGDRLFTSSASTSLSYAHSQRLSISFMASGNRMEHLNGGDQPNSSQELYLIPSAIEASAAVSVNYSLTPRTQVGVNLMGTRGFSDFDQAYTSSATAFIGRTMGRRWFAQARAGGGLVTQISSQYPSSGGATPVYGATLGYKTYAHSFLASYDRTVGQSYGVGAADTTTYNAAWRWSRPGRSWGLTSNYMRQQFTGGGFGDVTGWRAAFGVTRQMGQHAVLETAYTYAAYYSNSSLAPYNSTQNAVRVTVEWIPQGQERR